MNIVVLTWSNASKNADGMANTVDPDQTAPSGLWPRSDCSFRTVTQVRLLLQDCDPAQTAASILWCRSDCSLCPQLRASILASVRSSRVLKFYILIPHGKIVDTHFFSCPSYLPFWSYAPLKKSEWNLMLAISYEPCKLGFWNIIYGFLMEK